MPTMAKLLVLVLACALSQATSAAPTLFITTEYSPPSMSAEGLAVGPSTERVRDLMARAGIEHTIQLYPWKRAYSTALERRDGCVYPTTRTPSREALFTWIGPIDEGDWVLMGRAGREYNIRTLEDARALRIGTYNGDVRDEYLRANAFNVDPADNDMINPQKLLLGRIDLWAAGLRNSTAALRQFGWDKDIVPVLVFNHVKVYLACNRAVPDTAVKKLSAAVDAAVKDGTFERIRRKYEPLPDAAAAKPETRTQ